MATIVLSAVGLAAGNAIGGSVLGLSTGVLGRAIGATIGRAIDYRLLGSGSDPVETGKLDRYRISGASEGTAIAKHFGRKRVAGQVIWATRFMEHVREEGGGKGGPPTPRVREFTYTVSFAVALCEGEISGIGRVWADGSQMETAGLNMRVYHGTDDQMPDAKIEAVEGTGTVPAYRGLAYVVFEDLDLTAYGGRIPQLSFEVTRPTPFGLLDTKDVSEAVQAVAMIPGTGEYALATSPVYYRHGLGENVAANLNSANGKSDLLTSLDGLKAELPNCGAVSLVVSWFGDDLRCANCQIQPKVEQKLVDGNSMPWTVSGVSRAQAAEVPLVDDRVIYGGTPTDQSIIEAIEALKDAGQQVTFYPFILMDQLDGNGLLDPWTGAGDQPKLPWRGRITLSVAPGQSGSPDKTAAAAAEVASFFGSAAVTDFTDIGDGIGYTGPAEWSFRRMILHYAHLCAKAGGVDAFCIGSEMRGLTQIRGANNTFPAVEALMTLADDVRSILGPDVKISYAADWSEYFGYHPQDGSGDLWFHLDPLWSHPEIDFIGIDNYMPLSDWRDGDDHLDASFGAIYALDYLKQNVAGGEGYDWYYDGSNARDFQIRSDITDGAYSEPWVFRYKDLENWWRNPHHNRIAGVREAQPTNWEPMSKPFWFTEIGCAAIDKGTNQPNKFLDPKSSESSLPYYSNGRRDDFMQAQYLRALTSYWEDNAHNPVSEIYEGSMVDMSRAFAWAWDSRPYPSFPSNSDLWGDGENYLRGHWLNGRGSSRSLAGVVAEICEIAGVLDYDVSALWGVVRGYCPGGSGTARAELQPLMLAYGFDVIERDGKLIFRTRDGKSAALVDQERLAVVDANEGDLQILRAPEAEIAGRLRLNFVEADADFAARSEEAIFPDEATTSVAQSEMPLVLTKAEARGIVERWLSEARVARDTAQFSLPLSELSLGAGDVVSIEDEGALADFRIDQVEQTGQQLIQAVRVEREIYVPSEATEEVVDAVPFVAPVPVDPIFLDLPLLTGDEVPHAPHIAATARPWPGSVAVYSAALDDDYTLNTLLNAAATVGQTTNAMNFAKSGVLDRGDPVSVKLVRGTLSSVSMDALLNGANIAAIGDGSSGNWEVFQFLDAELIGERTYTLNGRLRGQAGTDGITPSFWPAGSLFVVLDGAVEQITLDQSARGLARNYRIGPALRPYSDASYSHLIEAFDGIGLRPYAPAHLRRNPDSAFVDQDGPSTIVDWIRRTRIDGDSWQSVEVPLGEANEAYMVRVHKNGALLRETTVSEPRFVYTFGAKMNDGAVAPYEISVAQMSDRFGPGPFKGITINE